MAKIFIIIPGLLNLFLGFWVWTTDKKKKLNYLFGIFGISTALVCVFDFIFRYIPSVEVVRWSYAFAVVLPGLSILWLFELLEIKKFKVAKYLILFFGVVFFVISLSSSLIIEKVYYLTVLGFKGKTGLLFPYYSIYIFISSLFIVVWTYIKQRKVDLLRKRQLRFVLLGILLYSLGASVFSLLLPSFFGIYDLTLLDAPSSLFFVVFSSYAIIKHHLLNVKLIATEIFLVLIDLTLLSDALMAKNNTELAIKLIIFLLVVFFSALFLRSIFKELATTEKLEKTAQELKDANEELTKLDQIKSEFMSIASHQLLTPLTPIRGYSSMLLEGEYGEVTARQRKVLEMVYASSVRLVDLASNLLDISRIERGVVEYKFEPANICKIIEGIVEEMKPRAQGAGLELVCRLPKEPAFKLDRLVNIDKDKIKEVLINLIDNAIKYSSTSASAKSKKQIEIKAEMGDDEVLVSIKDHGIGISKEDIPKLFKKFSRAEEVKTINVEGTGLGLYVAKQYIDAHKGRIWVESAGKGKGSTFWFAVGMGK